jgi:hypothetical protein
MNPSVLRQYRIASATSCPHCTPRAMDFPPSEIAAKDAVRLAFRSVA